MDLRQAMKEWVYDSPPLRSLYQLMKAIVSEIEALEVRLASWPQGTAPALSEQTEPKSPTTPDNRWAVGERAVTIQETAAWSPRHGVQDGGSLRAELYSEFAVKLRALSAQYETRAQIVSQGMSTSVKPASPGSATDTTPGPQSGEPAIGSTASSSKESSEDHLSSKRRP